MNKLIFAILMLPLSVLAEIPENQFVSSNHEIAITLGGGGGGAVGEMYGLEYEFHFLPGWSINAARMIGKELDILQDEFKATGISVKRTVDLSETWSVYASVGINRHDIYYEFREPCYPNCDFDSNTAAEPDLFIRDSGSGVLVSLGGDKQLSSKLYLGVRLTKIDLGKYPADGSFDFRLSYRF